MEPFCFSHIENELHHNFANSRLDGASSIYIENAASNVSLQLNAYCDGAANAASSSLPLVLEGPSGVGKSAALANWTRQRKSKVLPARGLGIREEFIFWHAVGCSRLSTAIFHLLRRLVTSLIRHFELKEPIDLADEKLPWVLPRLLDRASKKGKVIIVIDGGLHHICSKDESYGLKWLPLKLPPNVRMILSVTTPSENPPQISDHAIKLQHKIHRVWSEIQRRKWPMISIHELDSKLVTSVVEKYLPPKHNRELSTDTILSHQCAKNALFLTTILKGVRHVKFRLGFKSNEVWQCLNLWTSPRITGTNDLIEAMLKVFESGIQEDIISPPRLTLDASEATKLGSLLSHALSLLFVARHGLREDELLELVARVRENVRWKNQTKDTVIPIKLKMLQSICAKKNRLLDIFRSFDSDGNGILSREEFYNGMEKLNLEGVTHEEVTLLIDEVDSNGDGEIGKL